MLLYGAFIGITFDCTSTLKRDLTNKYYQIAVIIFYWIMNIPLIYIYIYNVNDGIFHVYIILFIIMGAIIYFKWMKPRFYHDLELLGKNIYISLSFIKKILNILVISPILFIYKLFSDIIIGILKILKVMTYTPFIKLRKWDLNKKKVKQSAEKVDGNKTK